MLLYTLIYICGSPFVYFIEIVEFVRFKVKVEVISKIRGVWGSYKEVYKL